MLPNKRDNIYPRTEANFLALIEHHFDIEHGEIRWFFDLKDYN